MKTASRNFSWINFVTAAAVFFVFADRAESQENQPPPIADAGPDIDLIIGGVAQLHGSVTDPGGHPSVSYSWNIYSAPESSSASLSDPSVADPAFFPDLVGDYVLLLVVSDGIYVSPLTKSPFE